MGSLQLSIPSGFDHLTDRLIINNVSVSGTEKRAGEIWMGSLQLSSPSAAGHTLRTD